MADIGQPIFMSGNRYRLQDLAPVDKNYAVMTS